MICSRENSYLHILYYINESISSLIILVTLYQKIEIHLAVPRERGYYEII